MPTKPLAPGAFAVPPPAASATVRSTALVDKEVRHSCTFCRSRMNSLTYDKHSLCGSCRGRECCISNKCDECCNWSEQEYDRFIKHCNSLYSSSMSRNELKHSHGSKSAHSKDNLCDSEAFSVISDSSSVYLVAVL